MKLGPAVRAVHRIEKKRTAQRCYISSNQPIRTKICMVVAVPNIIMCAKFGTEIFRGYDLQELEFSVFLLILAFALQQCSLVNNRLVDCYLKLNFGVMFNKTL